MRVGMHGSAAAATDAVRFKTVATTVTVPDGGTALLTVSRREASKTSREIIRWVLGIGQLAFNLNRIFSGEQLKSEGKVIDLSSVPKFYPAVVLYDDDIVNHAVRLHLHAEMDKWFDKHGIDRSRVGQTLVFSIKDIEYLELLAENKSVEAVLREYVAFIEQHPTEVQSLFHEFALACYPKETRSSRGYTLGTTDRVLTALQDELTRRKAEK